MLELLALMLVGHALADYPLQGDFLAKAKNHTAPILGVPWWQAMGAHCVIHAGFVGVITGLWWLGVAEALAHWTTDYAKCNGKLTFNGDQFIHVLCKAVWAWAAVSYALVTS